MLPVSTVPVQLVRHFFTRNPPKISLQSYFQELRSSATRIFWVEILRLLKF